MFFKHRRPETPLPDSVEECLALFRAAEDPREKRRILTHALEIDGDDLRVNRALLMLGGLGESKKLTVDFSLIKSYLLTVFVKPEIFTPEKRREMAREIFDHPQLKRCLQLSPDREGFLLDYIQELCDEHAQMFIDSASEYSGSLLGFSTANSRTGARVAPFVKALTNILDCPDLSADERMLLLRAMHKSAKGILGSAGVTRLYRDLEPRVAAALEG